MTQQQISPYYSEAPAATVAPRPKGLGLTAMILSVLAMLGGIIAAIALAIAIIDGEKNGRRLSDIPSDQQLVITLWALTFIFWTLLGLAGLVMGIIATVKRRGRGLGITAIILAILGPIVSFVTWVIATFVAVGATAAH